MSNPQQAPGWGTDLGAVVCEFCDSFFLLPPDSGGQQCPICFRDALDPAKPEHALSAHPPELVIPFSVDRAQIEKALEAFARSIPFRPADLTPQNLSGRLRPVFLPLWLVDVSMEGLWKAEAGYDYQVVSHVESYSGGGWQSQQVNKTQVRWEPRVGRVKRAFQNVASPAIEGFERLQSRIGAFSREGQEQPYSPDLIKGVFVRMPNRSTDDSWGDTAEALRRAGAEVCRQAIGAEQIQNFKWKVEPGEKQWSQLLLPVYTTYYLDDGRAPQVLIINGQTGALWGMRRASLRRAQAMAAFIVGSALLFFLCSIGVAVVGLLAGPLALVGVLGMAVAAAAGIAGILPIIRVTSYNRDNSINLVSLA